ncbi:phBC6A51 family helix-turn-helix protein [Ammoniphilus resinae]|uniref:DNA-binding XRE family transcriptional regulator n=1 Tax=Ammoniphilus resinae TaxID=861532 RepID=A0ABS4GXN6_9BACL|nr:phBC6A51 family helix-turn-helix protein [Ammoniphilus resinae]MBP1935016.1 DNA-binding XRE family transcriptional regulator [Ammoniphilus resinae]
MELLPQNQQIAAQLLASGAMEKQEIAKAVGVSRGTIYNWEKQEQFMEEVNRLKHEIKVFGMDMIAGKLAEAVQDYWRLIQETDNDRVKAEGYQYFINRNLGKPTTMIGMDEETGKVNKVNEDVLEAEFEEWGVEEE